jgi:predicted small metal-binding protein
MRLISLDELLEKINALPHCRSSHDISEIHQVRGEVHFSAKDIEEMLKKLTVYVMEE